MNADSQQVQGSPTGQVPKPTSSVSKGQGHAPRTAPAVNHIPVDIDLTYHLDTLCTTINACTQPTTFDLQGRTYRVLNGRPRALGLLLHLLVPNITIRNGTIDMDPDDKSESVSLCVGVPGILFEHLTLRGGGGLCVLPKGAITLLDCTLTGAMNGIVVGDLKESKNIPRASLTARNILVLGCREIGVKICPDGMAHISDSMISGSVQHGVSISGHRCCTFWGTGVTFCNNKMNALRLKSPLQAQLFNCISSGNGIEFEAALNTDTAKSVPLIAEIQEIDGKFYVFWKHDTLGVCSSICLARFLASNKTGHIIL